MTELRKDPVVGRWVIISTERAKRPQEFPPEPPARREGVCPLCPGSERMTPPEILAFREGGQPNDPNWTLRVVPNKFPALQIEGELGKAADGIYDRMHGIGAHEVVIESERHDIDLFDLPEKRFVRDRCLFCDIVVQEMDQKVRIVEETGEFLAFSPYAPRFPFETWIVPKRHQCAYEMIEGDQARGLAAVFRRTLRRLNLALENPPFNFIVHSAPFQERAAEFYHWHIEIMPKLTKVAGFEWGSGFYINPTPPEESAKYLRELPE
ncbi:MAG: galactose-phosphate uridylyltransferase [Deltaproteobacteria bacterium]|nr:galactose-phosphate uridylyltransferase [Deltaproteobacteria bacterium]